MVSYFTVLLRVEVRRELEFAYARGRLLVFGIREVSTPVGLPWFHQPNKELPAGAKKRLLVRCSEILGNSNGVYIIVSRLYLGV
jgi:hypothetical protein